jgi:pyruvate ferredoxin oxidoreductase gamma subunit
MSKQMLEIRWHGRGGQGAVTASKVLAASAMAEGKQIQAFPEYGSERQGAPIKAFTRISDHAITVHDQVTNPEVVVVLDPSLIGLVDVTEGLANDGILVINTDEDIPHIREKLKLQGRKVFAVDATSISIKHLGKAIPNTPMIGALVRAIRDLMPLNIDHIAADFAKKFEGKFHPDIVKGNVNALREAYGAVKGEG